MRSLKGKVQIEQVTGRRSLHAVRVQAERGYERNEYRCQRRSRLRSEHLRVIRGTGTQLDNRRRLCQDLRAPGRYGDWASADAARSIGAELGFHRGRIK